ncbi:hypothetical protein ACOSQ3_019793 [Xanthoceras sorbifolium]
MGRRPRRSGKEAQAIWVGGPGGSGQEAQADPGRRPRRSGKEAQADPGRRPRRSGKEAQADPGRRPRRSGKEAQIRGVTPMRSSGAVPRDPGGDPNEEPRCGSGRSGAMTPMRSPGVQFREIREDDPDEEPRCVETLRESESINTREKKNCVRVFSYKLCSCNSSFIVD